MAILQEGGGSQLMGGLSSMAGELGDPELQEDLQEISQVPGGMEMLFSEALRNSPPEEQKNAKKLRLYQIGGSVDGDRDSGGLSKYADVVREGGRGDDDILLHISPEEFEALESMWGTAEVNPITGLPEYGFLSKIFKKAKSAVKKITKNPLFSAIAPIALNMFVPGLGAAIGAAMGATGAAAATVGSAVLSAGFGAASGGTKGAIMGALSAPGVGGAAGRGLGMTGRMADVVGAGLLRGAGSSAMGGDFTEGAIRGGLGEYMRPGFQKGVEGLLGKAAGVFGGAPDAAISGLEAPQISAGDLGPAPSAGDVAVADVLGPEAFAGGAGGAGDFDFAPAMGPAAASTLAPGAFAGGAGAPPPGGDSSLLQDLTPLMLAASGMQGQQQEPARPPTPDRGEPLPQFAFRRGRYQQPIENYLTYGQGPYGEMTYFEDPWFEEEEERPLYQEGGPVYQTQTSGFGELPKDLLAAIQQTQAPSPSPGRPTDQPDYYTYGQALPGGGTGGMGGIGTGGGEEILYTPPPSAATEFMGNLDELSMGELKEILPEDYDYSKTDEQTIQRLANSPYWGNRFEGANEYRLHDPALYDRWEGMSYRDRLADWVGPRTNRAAGGSIDDRYYKGDGSGRDDLIDAKLSDGEYVMDAETVALLGDGSNDEGAKRLDEMRNNLRKHKGQSMRSGEFSDDAKTPESYLGGGRPKKPVKKARGGRVSADELADLIIESSGVEK